MTNYEIVSKTESFQKYVIDTEDLYQEASSIDKFELIFKELRNQGYTLNFCIMDLLWAYREDAINSLPKMYKN